MVLGHSGETGRHAVLRVPAAYTSESVSVLSQQAFLVENHVQETIRKVRLAILGSVQVSGLSLKVRSMQRSEPEAIRTQIQRSKLKQEITKI